MSIIDFFDREYFESGPQSGKSLYQNYRWIPELTIPLAHNIINYCNLTSDLIVTDFGCAKGYLVYALRLLNIKAYGVDISQYAINNCRKEIYEYLKCIDPLSDQFDFSDWIICKDILEHIPYEDIDKQISILRKKCNRIFVVVPLGKDGKYNIPAYELDKSHFIREPKEWWENKFKNNGFKLIESSHDLSMFKQNWHHAHPEGNLILIGEV